MAPALAHGTPTAPLSSPIQHENTVHEPSPTTSSDSSGILSDPPIDLRVRSPSSIEDWSLEPSNTINRRDETQPANPNFNPMAGARTPESFNNKGYFALFALLGAAMVVAAIWFFFWADNGGFKWRKGDWDDYKSTVMRRKDKYGNTLSNATPRTDLGQKSVAGTFDYEKRDLEKGAISDGSPRRHRRHKHSRPHSDRGNSDEDVRAYRNERSAKVGGLNRQHDGSHYDFTTSDYSYSTYSASNADDIASNDSRTHLRPVSTPSPKAEPAKKMGFLEKKKEQRNQKTAEKKVKKDQKKVDKAARKEDKKDKQTGKSPVRRDPETTRIRPAQRRPSFSALDAASTIADSDDRGHGANDSSYYANYRPEQPAFARSYGNRGTPRRSPARHSPRPSEPRQSSPLKREFMPKPPGSFDAYSDVGSDDTGTRVYQHHIPGLSRSGGAPSRSNGYRRGATGRRDSLSDSE